MEQLWKHQSEGIKRARGINYFGLFFEQGTGKTRTLIDILREKYTLHGSLLTTLIFCPKVVIENWKEEFKKYSRIDPKRVILLKGITKKKKMVLNKAAMQGTAIYITNYETMVSQEMFEIFLALDPDILVLDESHKVKDFRAKRTKRIYQISKRVRYRYLLSGTPILNSPIDIFSQYKILDHGNTFGNNFFFFRNTYFIDKNSGIPTHKYFPDWRLKEGALETISQKMSKTSLRVLKKDCLDLPPQIYQTHMVDMARDQKKFYLDLKRQMVATLNDKVCVTQMALTRALRLMQITSGYVPVDTGVLEFKDSPKEEALKELLVDLSLNHKILVWAVFRQNYKRIRQICKDIGLDLLEVHGEISDSDKQEAILKFNTDPKYRVLLGHPGSGGIGLNLTAADYSIFYSRTFSLEHSVQAESRNHRGGSEIHKKITRIDLVCRNTLDENVTKMLAKKQKISDIILKELLLKEGRE